MPKRWKSHRRKDRGGRTGERRRKWLTWGCGSVMALSLVGLVVLQLLPDGGRHENRHHDHPTAPHGGLVVSVGEGHRHYHVEVVFGLTGTVQLYTLGAETGEPVTVESQHLITEVRSDLASGPVSVVLRPVPESGPSDGPTSRFLGRLPAELLGRRLTFHVPALVVGGERLGFSFTWQSSVPEAEQSALVSEEQRQLYLTPGGRYTAADIEATGRQTAATKYRGQHPTSHSHARPGERICPVTRMKANPAFTWVVGGNEYRFCCAPCIDEFLGWAHEQPERIKSPEEYVQ